MRRPHVIAAGFALVVAVIVAAALGGAADRTVKPPNRTGSTHRLPQSLAAYLIQDHELSAQPPQRSTFVDASGQWTYIAAQNREYLELQSNTYEVTQQRYALNNIAWGARNLTVAGREDQAKQQIQLGIDAFDWPCRSQVLTEDVVGAQFPIKGTFRMARKLKDGSTQVRFDSSWDPVNSDRFRFPYHGMNYFVAAGARAVMVAQSPEVYPTLSSDQRQQVKRIRTCMGRATAWMAQDIIHEQGLKQLEVKAHRYFLSAAAVLWTDQLQDPVNRRGSRVMVGNDVDAKRGRELLERGLSLRDNHGWYSEGIAPLPRANAGKRGPDALYGATGSDYLLQLAISHQDTELVDPLLKAGRESIEWHQSLIRTQSAQEPRIWFDTTTSVRTCVDFYSPKNDDIDNIKSPSFGSPAKVYHLGYLVLGDASFEADSKRFATAKNFDGPLSRTGDNNCKAVFIANEQANLVGDPTAARRP